ncbi:Uu.00g090830.m01.CDS01 [Anthostomella pinea]|uniref:Uu.00g090830.m01.CDS01 n=1 Tax=Anthostomella pinea TaxID=933095 RepID=A0AAI8VNK5_9PEZI|nr:Uu.00g090830.m01.CDS01 [Anthostomella pinea]
MAAPLLFCTAEEAKPFVHKVMAVKLQGTDESLFNLVESRAGPRRDAEAQSQRQSQRCFKRALGQDEAFGAEFIGAPEHECQAWALEMQARHNFIEQDLIGIADARSARDGTLLIQFYGRAPGLECGDDKGVFPRETETNTWHGFRIDYREAERVSASLQFGASEVVYPVYFGRKEELTDERGVFDVARAERICGGEES